MTTPANNPVNPAAAADAEAEAEQPPPQVGIRIVYLGPVTPHWEIEGIYGDQAAVEEFRRRTNARLQLLPPHDPQFRRNRERVARDAERENYELHWDLGISDDPDDPDNVADAAVSGGRAL